MLYCSDRCICQALGKNAWRFLKLVRMKVKVKFSQSCPTLCDPMDYRVHGILQARILEWLAFLFSRDLPNPGMEPRSPSLQVDSLPVEPPGKPKNTGIGSLSLLHQMFPTLELNWGLLHCRWILYQPSYQGSPGTLYKGNQIISVCT